MLEECSYKLWMCLQIENICLPLPIMKGNPWGNLNIQCCEKEGNTNALLCINHLSAAYTCYYLNNVVLSSILGLRRPKLRMISHQKSSVTCERQDINGTSERSLGQVRRREVRDSLSSQLLFGLIWSVSHPSCQQNTFCPNKITRADSQSTDRIY